MEKLSNGDLYTRDDKNKNMEYTHVIWYNK